MVSIIIINYNTFELTCRCIESIISKTTDIEFEIILVDNASTDKSPALFSNRFPNIKLIKSEKNLGFAKGNNLGISHSTGDIILLLNSDTELSNNAINLSYLKMKADLKIGVLTCKLTYPNGSIQSVTGRFPSLKRELRELLRLNKSLSFSQRADYYLGDAFDHQTEKEVDWVWGAFFMFWKHDLENFPNNKLHDDFFMYFEDVQWCWHFKNKLGKKIIYYPEPLVVHHIGGSDNTQQDEKYLYKILPNMYKWMVNIKGWFYTKLFFFIKYLLYLSLHDINERKKAKMYLKLI